MRGKKGRLNGIKEEWATGPISVAQNAHVETLVPCAQWRSVRSPIPRIQALGGE